MCLLVNSPPPSAWMRVTLEPLDLVQVAIITHEKGFLQRIRGAHCILLRHWDEKG